MCPDVTLTDEVADNSGVDSKTRRMIWETFRTWETFRQIARLTLPDHGETWSRRGQASAGLGKPVRWRRSIVWAGAHEADGDRRCGCSR